MEQKAFIVNNPNIPKLIDDLTMEKNVGVDQNIGESQFARSGQWQRNL